MLHREMSLEYFQNLSNSMSKCLQMIIKKKGNMAKFEILNQMFLFNKNC